jgi:hypothetical protein
MQHRRAALCDRGMRLTLALAVLERFFEGPRSAGGSDRDVYGGLIPPLPDDIVGGQRCVWVRNPHC